MTEISFRENVYVKGDDYTEPGDHHRTFSIHYVNHAQQIKIYGNEYLRDAILTFLNQTYKPKIETTAN